VGESLQRGGQVLKREIVNGVEVVVGDGGGKRRYFCEETVDVIGEGREQQRGVEVGERLSEPAKERMESGGEGFGWWREGLMRMGEGQENGVEVFWVEGVGDPGWLREEPLEEVVLWVIWRGEGVWGRLEEREEAGDGLLEGGLGMGGELVVEGLGGLEERVAGGAFAVGWKRVGGG
jgi:hypothetical protein